MFNYLKKLATNTYLSIINNKPINTVEKLANIIDIFKLYPRYHDHPDVARYSTFGQEKYFDNNYFMKDDKKCMTITQNDKNYNFCYTSKIYKNNEFIGNITDSTRLKPIFKNKQEFECIMNIDYLEMEKIIKNEVYIVNPKKEREIPIVEKLYLKPEWNDLKSSDEIVNEVRNIKNLNVFVRDSDNEYVIKTKIEIDDDESNYVCKTEIELNKEKV